MVRSTLLSFFRSWSFLREPLASENLSSKSAIFVGNFDIEHVYDWNFETFSILRWDINECRFEFWMNFCDVHLKSKLTKFEKPEKSYWILRLTFLISKISFFCIVRWENRYFHETQRTRNINIRGVKTIGEQIFEFWNTFFGFFDHESKVKVSVSNQILFSSVRNPFIVSIFSISCDLFEIEFCDCLDCWTFSALETFFGPATLSSQIPLLS